MSGSGYEIVSIDLRSPEWGPKVCALMTKAFGAPFSADAMDAATRTQTLSGAETLHLAAVENNEVIGFNSFTAHELFHHGELVPAYQSGHSATDPAHRGRGIFVNIIEQAKTTLRRKGASFIFGWPNPNSRPIFIKKLGFEERTRLKKIVIPTPLAAAVDAFTRFRPEETYRIPSGYQQNDHQLITLKSNKYPNSLETFGFEENLLWGIVRTERKRGIVLRIFDTGGMLIHNPYLLGPMIRSFARRMCARGVFFLRISGEASNSYFDHLARAKETEAPEPFIVFDLERRTNESTAFAFFAGIKDVY